MTIERTPVNTTRTRPKPVFHQPTRRHCSVSRQFVDRLIADGKLTHRYKPGSKHRIISITEINNLKDEREHGRNGVRRAIDALVDGGVEY